MHKMTIKSVWKSLKDRLWKKPGKLLCRYCFRALKSAKNEERLPKSKIVHRKNSKEMKNIISLLNSALYELASEFESDKAEFHFALSIVFSSILTFHGYRTVIVGGQAAVYWTRLTTSEDVDFVCANYLAVKELLGRLNFVPYEGSSFRFLHEETDAMLELVGEKLRVANLDLELSEMIGAESIEHPLVKKLMLGPAEVINPFLVFLNYLDAAISSFFWYDSTDQGNLALERARAIYSLMPDYIVAACKKFLPNQSKLNLDLLKKLYDEFGIEIGKS